MLNYTTWLYNFCYSNWQLHRGCKFNYHSKPIAGSSITGTTEITLTVTDAANNSAVATFDVAVLDNDNPVITSTHNNQDINVDIKELKGILQNKLRIRKGKIRIIIEIIDTEVIIESIIEDIDFRGNIYK